MTDSKSAAEQLAERFHEAYERLAPSFGYETRKDSAKPWSEVPEQNRRLMIAVCAELFPSPPSDEELRGQIVNIVGCCIWPSAAATGGLSDAERRYADKTADSILSLISSRLAEAEARIRGLETEVLDAAFSDRIDDAGSPLTWKEIALAAEEDARAEYVRANRAEARLAKAEEAALNAKLPDHFRWGPDAMEQFNFGKERAALAVRALSQTETGE